MVGLLAVPAAILACIGIAIYGGRGVLWVYRLTKRMDERIEYLDREMRPNSGKSLRDAIDRLDDRAARNEQRTTRIEQHLGIVEPQVSEIHEAVVDGD